MTRTELAAGLRRLARNARAFSAWNAAAAAALRPQYDVAVNGRPASMENHLIAVELYPLVIDAERDAKHWLDDAALLEEAIDYIEQQEAI